MIAIYKQKTDSYDVFKDSTMRSFCPHMPALIRANQIDPNGPPELLRHPCNSNCELFQLHESISKNEITFSRACESTAHKHTAIITVPHETKIKNL